ncbi:MAG: cupredoxin domain-containing protein [Chloroflexota bacterium]|nr:cupredoxin domain-containing protein [Chloroflexota bacterium]
MRIRRYPAAAALAFVLVACGGTPATQPPAASVPAASEAPGASQAPESEAPESEAPESEAPESEAPPSEAAGSDSASVAIADNSFSPTAVEVSVGGEVVWSHRGQNPHTVTFADDGPDSGNLAGGETFRTTFDEAGEFSYVCEIHPQMQGTVTVSE